MLLKAKSFDPDNSGYSFEAKDINKAIEWYKKAANAGNKEAINWLGKYYFNNKNYSKALYWLEEKGGRNYHAWNVPNYSYMVAEMYRKGLGVPQNYERAIEIYEENEDKRADFLRAEQQGQKIDLDTLQKVAELGDLNAMKLLAILYDCYGGGSGYPYLNGACYKDSDKDKQNARKAAQWYKKIVEQTNDPEAMFLVATNESSQAKRFQWFKKSAEQGYSWALYMVAYSYYYEVGTVGDGDSVKKYAKLSCEEGIDYGCLLYNKSLEFPTFREWFNNRYQK
ncbi:Sel1 repeat protein [Haemophilus sputorum HK 2154]|nr:Sel1 repeat protein [Haemophilus sputorum HK 2154]